MLSAALDAVGLNRAVLGLGDADLYRQLLTELGVEGGARGGSSTASPSTTSSGSRWRWTRSPTSTTALVRRSCGFPGCAAARRSWSRPADLGGPRWIGRRSGCWRRTTRWSRRGVADRVQLDLGLLRDLGYYTGAIVEVYDPALGHILGGGGRYDDLLGRFGRAAPRGGIRPLPGARPPRPGEEERFIEGAPQMRGRATARPVRGRRSDPFQEVADDADDRGTDPRGSAGRSSSRSRGGALWGETLDALDRIGVETSEMRGESRSLVFSSDGLTLVTMRPSDVPTYVEAGAADLGITGKDVLMEQADRTIYEILDLAYGACTMVLAGRLGDESLGESERRLGGMRIRDQVPADRRGATSRRPAGRPRWSR